MSDTQGSHRRGGPLPEVYGAEHPAWPADAGGPGTGPVSGDGGGDLEAEVPAPRGGARRGGRRRRTPDAP
ncbi:hypothetical protein ACFWAW_17110, partial [Streptomyces sp. NPDC059979]